MALTKAKLEKLAEDTDIAILANVKTAAITAVSGWDLSDLNVAKSGGWMFISGSVGKTDGVIGNDDTKVATMSAGYRPAVLTGSSAAVGDSYVTAAGEVYIKTDGDMYIGSLDASDRDFAEFTIIYPIA